MRKKRELGEVVGIPLGYWLRTSLRDSLGVSLRDSLGNSLRFSLGVSLGNSLRDSLGNSLRDSLHRRFVVAFVVGFVV